jgi:hypothetical protein
VSGAVWALRQVDGTLVELGGIPFLYRSSHELGGRAVAFGEQRVRVVVIEQAKLEALEAELRRLQTLAR